MRISVIVLFSAVCIFCQPASAQNFRTDYDSLVSLEKDFSDAEEGVRAALQGKFDGNAEYRCVYLVLESSSHLKDIFVQYKFSVAIRDVIKDQEDRGKGQCIIEDSNRLDAERTRSLSSPAKERYDHMSYYSTGSDESNNVADDS